MSVVMEQSMEQIDYEHRHSAHCENGVTAGLFSHHGLTISEAMVFGVGSGLFFAYAPFLKIGTLPMTTYRIMPGHIFKKVAKRLGVKWKSVRFRDKQKAMDQLDAMIAGGIPVGCQTGAFWLPYFPDSMRFHFNAHNIVVYGKKDDEYMVSDPVMDEPVTIAFDDLQKSRFAQGPLAPRGRLYYPTYVPTDVDLRKPIVTGIKETCFSMLTLPIIFAGISGIRLLARRMRTWPQRLGDKHASRCLGSVIRMQEEIGTGGAGFRFIYAAFLQEAAEIFENDDFNTISERLTLTGDKWREFARLSARNCKRRASAEESYDKLGSILLECADEEQAIFKDLRKLVKGLRVR